MYKLLLLSLSAVCVCTAFHAQVEIDKPIHLTGADGERTITQLENPVNATDAANKAYVDEQVSTFGAGPYTFSVQTGRASIQLLDMPTAEDTTLVQVTRLTGTVGLVSVSVSGFPSGMEGDIYSGAGFISFRSVLEIRRVSEITPGTYTLTVTAEGGGMTETTTVDVEVIEARRVFITSTTYTGNLGGLAGADALCQSSASAASLGGNWKAWLSTSSDAAADRLEQFSGPYLNLDGSLVANGWSDLTDGTLVHHIRNTEWGTSPPAVYSGYAGAWSNTFADGSADVNDCSEWTSSSSSLYSLMGLSYVDAVPNEWSRWTGVYCDTPLSLYCFEQP